MSQTCWYKNIIKVRGRGCADGSGCENIIFVLFIEEVNVQKNATFKIPPESSRELLEANIIHTEEENFVGNLAIFSLRFNFVLC